MYLLYIHGRWTWSWVIYWWANGSCKQTHVNKWKGWTDLLPYNGQWWITGIAPVRKKYDPSTVQTWVMNNFVKTEPPFPPLFSLLRHNICIEEIKALMNYDQIFFSGSKQAPVDESNPATRTLEIDHRKYPIYPNHLDYDFAKPV